MSDETLYYIVLGASLTSVVGLYLRSRLKGRAAKASENLRALAVVMMMIVYFVIPSAVHQFLHWSPKAIVAGYMTFTVVTAGTMQWWFHRKRSRAVSAPAQPKEPPRWHKGFDDAI